MDVILLRGISGSGKSTWANRFAQYNKDVLILSADHERMVDGKYVFNPKDNRPHENCFKAFLAALLVDVNKAYKTVIVDNTNLAVWEVAPYYRIAEVMQHDVKILQIFCLPELAAERNQHGLTLSKILLMDRTFRNEILPGHWKVETTMCVKTLYPDKPTTFANPSPLS